MPICGTQEATHTCEGSCNSVSAHDRFSGGKKQTAPLLCALPSNNLELGAVALDGMALSLAQLSSAATPSIKQHNHQILLSLHRSSEAPICADRKAYRNVIVVVEADGVGKVVVLVPAGAAAVAGPLVRPEALVGCKDAETLSACTKTQQGLIHLVISKPQDKLYTTMVMSSQLLYFARKMYNNSMSFADTDLHARAKCI